MNLTSILVRIGFAVSLLSSAASHAYLYVHGYQHIPMIGTAFLIQASVSFAMAALILLGGPWWLRWTAAALAGGSVVAFALSRTGQRFGGRPSPEVRFERQRAFLDPEPAQRCQRQGGQRRDDSERNRS